MPLGTFKHDAGRATAIKRVAYGIIGLALGGIFLYLALRNIDRRELDSVVQRLDRSWLISGVAVYMASIALRCVRWGLLLRTNSVVKWRHVSEALIAGFAANYLLPARIGELFRADYAMRLFHMSRFTSLGTIFVERVFDGVILVCGLWISLGILSLSATNAMPIPSWAIAVGVVGSTLFSLALIFVVFSRRIDLRRFGLSNFFADRWDRMTDGISSVTRGQTGTVILCSLGVWTLEAIALGTIVRAFGTALSIPQIVALMGLATLSTLVPTAPGFLGTYQFVFGQVFSLFGYPESAGVVVATTLQLFCFGGVTIVGVFVFLSRSGLSVVRAMKLQADDLDRP